MMKKILMGFLTLVSISASADCYYEMSGYQEPSRENQIARIMKKKGFSNRSPDKAAYILDVNCACTHELRGDRVCWADASLERISDKVIVASGSRNAVRVFGNIQLKRMLRKIIKPFPTCAELALKP